MKKLHIILLAILTSFLIYSCEDLGDGLSTDEVVEGLKTALKVGTDSSSTDLSQEDGYYGNDLVKVPLPDEVEVIQKEIEKLKKKSSVLGSYFSSVTGQLFEDVRIGVNKAAEGAASEAAPIFGESIENMSIADGWDILNGTNPADTSNLKSSSAFDSTAATQYFKSTTKVALIDLYAPKIDYFLDQPLVKKKSGEAITPNSAFSTLKTTYNDAYDDMQVAIAADNLASGIFGLQDAFDNTNLKPITTPSIGTFCTDKALDGLFYMVGEEEIKIRRDPWAWVEGVASAVGDILVKVFGGEGQA